MVPPQFTDFFVACAGVAGALIGLLFVAISVSSEHLGPVERLEFDVRAGVAFSALTDSLVVALFALIPGVRLGVPALVVAVAGIASCVAMGIVMWRTEGIDGRARKMRLLALQAAVFVAQVVPAVQLAQDPHDDSAIRSLAVLTVVFFLIGMARAWQLIGGRDTSLLHVVRTAVRQGPVAATGTTDEATGSDGPTSPGPSQRAGQDAGSPDSARPGQ